VLSVALTGNVASGKSAVAGIWREAGVPVVSADDLARKAVEPGSPGLAEIEAEFGPGIRAADGSLDRAELRSRVFGDEAARTRLEAILHPRIEDLRNEWLEARRGEGHALVVSEIPLLFEIGAEDRFDATVLVHAPAGERLRRMLASRELEEEEARRIMAAQMDPEAKRERADYVLDNDGSREELEGRARELLRRLRSRAAPGSSG
jgi:dephospho-CoA kinase